MISLHYEKVRNVLSPKKAHTADAGIDFFVPEDFTEQEVLPGDSILVPSGIKIKIPDNYCLIAFNKSGLASKYCLQVLACVIDSGYQGEIHLNVINLGHNKLSIYPGMKLVQFILLPTPAVELNEYMSGTLYMTGSARGKDGFGSTDTQEAIWEKI